MIRLQILIFFIFGLIAEFAVSTHVFGQQPLSQYSETQYVYKNWDNESGLVQNTVFDILEDDRGFLWVATEEGLARFDGNSFKIINQATNPDLHSTYFTDLSTSSQGGIWAASRNTILKVNDHSSRAYDFRSYLDNSWITSITEEKGTLWVGTDNGLLLTLQNGTIKPFNTNSKIPGVIQVLQKVKNRLLLGTTEGLYELKDNAEVITKIPAFNSWNIRTLAIDKNENIWAGTEQQGLFHHLPDETIQFTENDGLPEQFITSLAFDEDDNLWIGTSSSGLYVFNDGKFKDGNITGFSNDDIKTIYISKQNLIWIGTSGSGLMQVSEANIYRLPDDLGLSDNIILPIYEYKNGDIWLGTAGKGVYRIKDGEVNHYTRDDGLTNEIVLSIYGTDNEIYVGTAGGLNRFNLDTEIFDRQFYVSDGLSGNITQVVFQDSAGNTWVATSSGGIHIINNETIDKINLPSALDNADFLSLFEDKNNNIWVGSDGSGMLRIDSNHNIKHYSNKEYIPFDRVYSFFEDEEGTLWMATENGLAYLSDNEFGLVDRSNGLTFNTIFTIVRDDSDFLWLSGNFGLQRVSLNQLQKIRKQGDKDFNLSVRSFDSSDGMVNSEANGAIFPAGWKMNDGTIWFPTVAGVAVVRPRKINEFNKPVETHIESMRFSNNEFTPNQNISIPAGVYNFEIDYTSVEFMNPSSVNFSYRLKELNEDWENVNKRRTAYFTTLDPGKYTFQVRAEQFGQYSHPAILSFEVASFFYQTWWFQIGVLLLLFGAGYLVKQLHAKYQVESKLQFLVEERTKDLQHALSEKDVLIKEVHHRVKNNLAIISGLMELQKYSTENEELQKAFYASQSRIRSIALIHEQLYQLENFSKLNFKIVLENLLEFISDLYDSEQEIIHELDLQPVELNVNQAIPAALFTNEVLVNSYKHAFEGRKSGTLFVSVKEDGNHVTLILKDDGVGAENGLNLKSPDTLGLKLIDILAQQLEADLKIETKEGICYTLEFEKSDKKGSSSGIIQN